MQTHSDTASIRAELANKPTPAAECIALEPLAPFTGSYVVPDTEAETAHDLEEVVEQIDALTSRKVRRYRRRVSGFIAYERPLTLREADRLKAGGALPEHIELLPPPPSISASHFHGANAAAQAPRMCVQHPANSEHRRPKCPWWMAATLVRRGLARPADDTEAKRLAAAERANAKAVAV